MGRNLAGERTGPSPWATLFVAVILVAVLAGYVERERRRIDAVLATHHHDILALATHVRCEKTSDPNSKSDVVCYGHRRLAAVPAPTPTPKEKKR